MSLTSVDCNEEHVQVSSGPESRAPYIRSEAVPLHSCSGHGALLDLNCELRRTLAPVKDEVHPLVVYEARRDVQPKAAGQDARGRDEVFHGLALAGSVTVIRHIANLPRLRRKR